MGAAGADSAEYLSMATSVASTVAVEAAGTTPSPGGAPSIAAGSEAMASTAAVVEEDSAEAAAEEDDSVAAAEASAVVPSIATMVADLEAEDDSAALGEGLAALGEGSAAPVEGSGVTTDRGLGTATRIGSS